MILPLQKFSTLVENMTASVQGSAAQLLDVSPGSILRALLEACAAVALWMQWLILQVLATTRAATSTGSDLDSWMADYSFYRLAGSPSIGQVTFARYTPGTAAIIAVGTTVSTNDGAVSFTVTADPSNSAWNGNAGYNVAPAAISINLSAQAVSPGSAGNVLPGAIGLLATAVPGIDTVGNVSAFNGGSDPESDVAFRNRFQLYINSRSLATPVAIDSAIASLQQGLRYAVLENTSPAGQFSPGNFWVVVDDGSGNPSSVLLSNVSSAVDEVRPIGARYAVTGPSVIPVAVQVTVVTSNLLTKPVVVATIQAAVQTWIAGLPIAGRLAVSKIEALAHDSDPTVISVTTTTINGWATDVVAPINGVIIASTVTVS